MVSISEFLDLSNRSVDPAAHLCVLVTSKKSLFGGEFLDFSLLFSRSAKNDLWMFGQDKQWMQLPTRSKSIPSGRSFFGFDSIHSDPEQAILFGGTF